MLLLYALALLASPLPASQGTASITSYSADGIVVGIGEAWVISPTGRLLAGRSLLRGASRAEVSIDGTKHCVASVEGEDEDLDLVELQIESGETALPFLEPAASSGTGEIVRSSNVNPHGSRAQFEDGRIAAFTIALRGRDGDVVFLAPGERAWRLARTGSLGIAEWNAKRARKPQLEDLYRRGLTLAWTGDHEGARLIFRQVIGQDSGDARAWFHLGFANAKLGRQSEKMQAFKRAIAADPSFGEAQLQFGHGLSADRRSPGCRADGATPEIYRYGAREKAAADDSSYSRGSTAGAGSFEADRVRGCGRLARRCVSNSRRGLRGLEWWTVAIMERGRFRADQFCGEQQP